MSDGAEPDPQALARDWVTLWQSELAALASDREAQEAWRTCLALWAGMALHMLPAGGRDGAPGGGRPADAPRSAAAAAASAARDAEIDRLTRHVAELERRLAQLERGAQ